MVADPDPARACPSTTTYLLVIFVGHLGLSLLPYVSPCIFVFLYLEFRRTRVCRAAASFSRRFRPSNPPEYSSTYYTYIMFPALLDSVALSCICVFCAVSCVPSTPLYCLPGTYYVRCFFFRECIPSGKKECLLAVFSEFRLRETFGLNNTNHRARENSIAYTSK